MSFSSASYSSSSLSSSVLLKKKKKSGNADIKSRQTRRCGNSIVVSLSSRRSDDDDVGGEELMMNRRATLKTMMMTTAAAFATTTTTSFGGVAFAGGESLVNVGDVAPDFTLPSTGGGSIALKDILAENDYAVVYFYNQDGSTGCSIEAERFNQAQDAFKAKKARVLGISMDSIESHEGFCDKKGLTFSLLSDGDGSVSKAYGAELTLPVFGKFSDRQTFLVGKDGKVKAHWKEMGAKTDEEKMASVKSTAHVEQVLAAM
jgi:peroxiredoxin Q/BCP